jgi:hypothetical protein
VSQAEELSNLELARVLMPPEGLDWGEIARSKSAEARFVSRVDPHLHEEFETVWRTAGAASDSHPGMGAMLEALRRVGQSFEELVALPETFVEVESGVLLLLHRRGRTVTGLEFDEAGAAAYLIEGGKLKQLVLYSNQALALTDAGLTAEEAAKRGIASDDLPMPSSEDD